MKFAPLPSLRAVCQSSTPRERRDWEEDLTGCLTGVGVRARARGWPFSLWVPWAGNQRSHGAHPVFMASCLPFSNEIICFYFPCHKDEVSFNFMANVLNSKPLQCVSSLCGSVWCPQPGSGNVYGKEPWRWLRLLALLSKFTAGPPVKGHPGLTVLALVSHPPSQDRFIFKRSVRTLNFLVLSHLISIEKIIKQIGDLAWSQEPSSATSSLWTSHFFLSGPWFPHLRN